MRDRLIELIQFAEIDFATVKNMHKSSAEVIANHLLENGVIVLPLKLDGEAYCLAQPCGGCKNYTETMQEEFIEQCRKCERWEIIKCKFDYELVPEYGKTVFATREEAEAALKARENNAN